MQNPVQMAIIGAVHGIRGEVRVKTFTGDPLALGDYGPLYASDGRAFKVLDIRPAGTVVVVRFKGVADRNAAEALNGTALFVDRAALPDDNEEGSFYHADLVGLDARDDSDQPVGKIVAVQNFGGGDILEIARDGGKDVLIPFTQAAVPVVDVAGGFVTIDLVAAGLVDDNEASGKEERAPGGRADRGFDAERRPRGPKDAGGNR